MRTQTTRITSEKIRKFISFVPNHRHSWGFKVLQGFRDIQYRFSPCTYNCHRSLSKFLKIGWNIEGSFCTSVHSTDASCDEYTYSCPLSTHHCRGNSCTSISFSTQNGSYISSTAFSEFMAILCCKLYLFLSQSYIDYSIYNGYCCRDCSLIYNDLFNSQGSL